MAKLFSLLLLAAFASTMYNTSIECKGFTLKRITQLHPPPPDCGW